MNGLRTITPGIPKKGYIQKHCKFHDPGADCEFLLLSEWGRWGNDTVRLGHLLHKCRYLAEASEAN